MLKTADLPTQVLIAPAGAGKTLAGFLPSLIELATQPSLGLHTFYISSIKALAADIKRSLISLIGELGLNISVENRTGDTSSHIKKRQRSAPPHILLCAYADAINLEILFVQIKQAGPYNTITRREFDASREFCATGGCALRRYDQWHRLQ